MFAEYVQPGEWGWVMVEDLYYAGMRREMILPRNAFVRSSFGPLIDLRDMTEEEMAESLRTFQTKEGFKPLPIVRTHHGYATISLYPVNWFKPPPFSDKKEYFQVEIK
jgi:hypothetical protein